VNGRDPASHFFAPFIAIFKNKCAKRQCLRYCIDVIINSSYFCEIDKFLYSIITLGSGVRMSLEIGFKHTMLIDNKNCSFFLLGV
jgi:hypothetical protein